LIALGQQNWSICNQADQDRRIQGRQQGGGRRDTKGTILLVLMRIGIRLTILADQINPECIGWITCGTEGNDKAIVLG